MTTRSQALFPDTRLSVLRAAASGDADARGAALEVLATIYWRPVYARYRLKWRLAAEDAEDLVQEFFAGAMSGDFFERYDPARARFRTYFRVCADRFAANARRDGQRRKRGGGAVQLPWDVDQLERELAGAPDYQSDAEADAAFDHEWVRALFAEAIERLRAATVGTSREIRFILLRRYDLEPEREAERPGYRALAETYGLPVTQVTNHLAWARRELRRLLLERVQALCASDTEFREEAARVLGEHA